MEGKRLIGGELVQNMNHTDLVNSWIDQQPDHEWVITEAPVSTDSARTNKSIDMVLIENYNPPLGEVYNTAMESAGSINPQKIDKMEAVLAHAPDPLDVRVLEAKPGKITFRAIGQCLSYSELFPKFYQSIRTINVVERGIVYQESDEFVEEAAEELGIRLHKFPNN